MYTFRNECSETKRTIVEEPVFCYMLVRCKLSCDQHLKAIGRIFFKKILKLTFFLVEVT